MSDYGK